MHPPSIRFFLHFCLVLILRLTLKKTTFFFISAVQDTYIEKYTAWNDRCRFDLSIVIDIEWKITINEHVFRSQDYYFDKILGINPSLESFCFVLSILHIKQVIAGSVL